MKLNKIAMNTLSILIGVIVILAVAGVAYLFRSELQDDHNMIEESVQNKHSIETKNNVVEVNSTVSDVETKKIQGLTLTPAVAEGNSLQTVEIIEKAPPADEDTQETTTAETTASANEAIEEVKAIEAVSNQQSQAIEETTATTVLEKDKEELQSKKEVATPMNKVSNAEKTVDENTQTELITSDSKNENQLVNKTESDVTQTEKQQTQETVKTTTIDNPVDDVTETKKEDAEQIVTEENKPKDDQPPSEAIHSEQSDSIKAAIQRQIKKSKQVLKLLTDHEER
jgi:hypothetical protein